MSSSDSGANIDHECDLFLLSSRQPYSAQDALDAFARQGDRNRDGWGIGGYVGGNAKVLRTNHSALNFQGPSAEYVSAARDMSSSILLGHLRLTSAGDNRPENNHPFELSFLGYEWLFCHNGTSHAASRLVPPSGQQLDFHQRVPRFRIGADRLGNHCR